MSRRFDGTASIAIRAYQRKLTSSPSNTIQVNRPVAYARARDPEHLRSPCIAEGEFPPPQEQSNSEDGSYRRSGPPTSSAR